MFWPQMKSILFLYLITFSCTIFKTFETPILNEKQNSLTGPVISGSFEKRAPGVEYARLWGCPVSLTYFKLADNPSSLDEANRDHNGV